jgi:two-component system nitrogen regulation response regulator GlnG
MRSTGNVWVVDDDESIRWVLERALSQAGIQQECFEDAESMLRRLAREQPDVVISDIRMPGIDGIELLRRIREEHPDMPVIITTAHSDLDSAVASYQQGAFEYLPKPFDIDEVVAVTERALAQARENSRSRRPVPAAPEAVPEIIGEAPAMQEVFRAIGRLAHSNITVLINGESGTGKELVARALHRHSPRAGAPFIALNMAAIPRDLMESELFGHEKGAFTGANSRREGRFEQANGGTCSSTRSATCPRRPRHGCCVCWPTASSTASAATWRCVPMYASSPPRTRTSRNWCAAATFARTCSIAST